MHLARIQYICFFLAVWSSSLLAEQLKLQTYAESAILMNADTGAILYAKNPHQLQYPASVTKIATALYVCKKKGKELHTPIAAEQEVIGWVSEEAIRRSNYTLPSYLLIPGCSHVGIKKGEVLTLGDLLHGTMLASGDDASNIIAQYTSGSIPKFMEELNLYLRSIGCQNTLFQNPHGLHHPRHQTTAYDMALLTKEALKDPIFREIVSTVRYTRPKTNKQESATWIQSNKLLRQGPFYYSKAIGVKTGYLSIANNTFVAAAKDGDRTLIAVLMKVPERKDIFLDAIKMFETAFNQPKIQRELLRKGEQKFNMELAGAGKPVQTFTKEAIKIEYYPAEEPEIKSYLTWYKTDLPIKKEQPVGEIVIQFNDGSPSKKAILYALDETRKTWQTWVKEKWKNSNPVVNGTGVLMACLLIGFGVRRRRRR